MYGKLFASMFRGSLYGKWQAIITFQQMIILADKDGTVDFTLEALTATTSIPVEILREGIALLEAPDPTSRTPDEDGRRIVLVDPSRPWGWRIVNYQKYREIRTSEERRDYHRQYWHKRKSQPDSTDTQQTQPIAEAEAEAEAVTTSRKNVPFSDILNLYHKKLPELPRIVKLTDSRKSHIRQRWLQDLGDLEEWGKYFDIVRKSNFLMGKSKSKDGRPPFRADLEWLCKPNNICKVIEGKYHV